MAISFNTGNTATITNSGTPSGTFTIPVGVLSGDTVLVLVWSFTTATGTLTNTLTSGGTTAPVLVGTQQTASGASIQAVGAVFKIAAVAGDPGATLTFGTSGGTGGSYWFNVGLVAYTGALGGVDVSAGGEFFSASSTGTTTTPSATTVASGDWQVQLLGVGPSGGNATTTPGTLTSREAIPNNSGLTLEIADSNASVGGSSTSIGNTLWTYTGTSGNAWSTSFTVGLSPVAAGTAVSSPALPPLIPPGRMSPMAFRFIPQAIPSYQSSSVQNVLTLSAQVTGSGSVQRGTARILLGLAVVTGIISRALGKFTTGVIVALSAAVRQAARPLSGITAVTGSSLRSVIRQVSAQVTASAAMTAQRTRIAFLAAQAVMTAAMGTRTGRLLSGTSAVTGAAVRAVTRTLTAAVAAIAATGITKVKLLSLAALATVSGTLGRSSGKLVNAPAAITGKTAASTGKSVLSALTVTGTAQRSVGRTLAAITAVTSVITLIKVKLISLTAAVAASSSLGMRSARSLALSALTALSGSVSSKTGKLVTAVTVAAPSAIRSSGKALTAQAVISASTAITKVKLLALAAMAAVSGTSSRNLSRTISAQSQVTAAAVRKMTRSLAVAVIARASSLRTRMVILAAGARTAASVTMQVVNPVALIIFKLGIPVFRWITGNITKNWKSP